MLDTPQTEMLLKLLCLTTAILLSTVKGNQELLSNSATSSNVAEEKIDGRLEVQFAIHDTNFCSGEFGIAEANAACKYLGFSKAVKYEKYDEMASNQAVLDCPIAILFHLTCNETKRISKVIECEKSNSTSGLSKTVIIAISVGVAGFVLGSCMLYFTLPLIGYAIYRLKILLCFCCWKSFEEYQNQKDKEFGKQVLVNQDALPAKKGTSNAEYSII